MFRKLVASLNDEAGARQIAVVSRAAPATYRVRGYVSALVERDKTIFAWVWDVYDADKRRALRITGEEPAAPAAATPVRRDAWAAADEQVLRRMARNGMEQIAGFLNSPEPPPPAAAPEPTLMTLVSGRDDRRRPPESSGCSAAQDQPLDAPRAGQPPPTCRCRQPPPKRRKKLASAAASRRRRPTAASPGR